MPSPPLNVTCILKCAAYPTRVADLSGSNIDEGIIGFHQTNDPNQRWTIDTHPFTSWVSGSMSISTSSNQGKASPHVPADKLWSGAKVEAALYYAARPWLFDQINLTRFLIYCFDCEGIPLYWTLPSLTEKTQVVLRHLTGGETQIWEITPAASI